MQKLQRVIVGNDGDLQTSRLPNTEEMMNKINEIVDWINKNENTINKLRREHDMNEFRKSLRSC